MRTFARMSRRRGKAGATPFFEEVFTGGVKNNANGFTWSAVAQSNGTVTVSADRAFSGTHSLKIAYNTTTQGDYTEPTQFFSFGRNLTELWLEFYLWLPTGYAHGIANNKMLRVWSGTYGGAENKMGFSTWPKVGAVTQSTIQCDRVVSADPSYGIGPSGAPESPIGDVPTSIYGTWAQMRLHQRVRTDAGSDNSISEAWINGNKLFTYTPQAAVLDTVAPYWDQGYLFGAANGFAAQTSVYADAFKFYDANPGWV